MSSSLQKIIESKRVLRRELASQTVAAKLRALEVLRERQIEIRQSSADRNEAPRR